MKLEDMKPDRSDLVRPFWFPENANQETGIKVWLQYLSPEVRTEVQDKVRIKMQRDGKADAAPGDQRRAMIQEVLLEAVTRCEFATFRKLSALVPLKASAVASSGGLDATVPMDPDVAAEAKEARENILYLLNASDAFATWAMQTCGDISRFQAADWEDRIKNSNGGQSLSSAQTPLSTTPTP